MRIVTCVVGLALLSVVTQAMGAPKPPSPAPTPVGDTMLEISHATIVASIIGCDVVAHDTVLVNGTPADGDLWSLISLTPASPIRPSATESRILASLKQRPALNPPQVIFWLKPGYYNLAISVGTCRARPFPLIAADPYGLRHVTIITGVAPTSQVQRSPSETPAMRTSPPATIEEGNLGPHLFDLRGDLASSGLFGSAPLDAQVSLHGIDSNNLYYARVENQSDALGAHNMYYFDAIRPGRYGLRVDGFGWGKELGTVELIPGRATFHYIKETDVGL